MLLTRTFLLRGGWPVVRVSVPYFFILPGYALLLAFFAIAALVALRVPSWRPACGYLVGGAVGTVPGFLVANVAVTVAGLLPVALVQHLSPPQWVQQVGTLVSAGLLLIGPWIASAFGVALGFAAGVFWVFSRRRRTAA